ncbi:unnamed protein product [Lactuca saligna]|uniref:Uncharacterized protein n=1 Tax=Lactuca saligna TaxID=75948 RepID=A0AA35YL09_LACSI|nr:unnamed protein product [Lactuca saligna]
MAHHPPGGAALNSRRSRSPLGLIPAVPSVAVTGIPVLLDGASDSPMHTINRRSPNLFIPDSQMMFNMLSVCDHMMTSTEEFLNSNPGWIPIVSQLYVSVLWVVHILRVFAKYGYGGAIIHNSICDYFVGYEECMIPGPLVPFFQSIAAVNGPFDWIGDMPTSPLRISIGPKLTTTMTSLSGLKRTPFTPEIIGRCFLIDQPALFQPFQSLLFILISLLPDITLTIFRSLVSSRFVSCTEININNEYEAFVEF